MKRLIAYLCLIGLIGATAQAQLPIHYNSVTSDVSKIKGNYDGCNLKWLGFNTQSNSIFVKQGANWVDMDALSLSYKISRNTPDGGVVTYVLSSDINVTDSNAVFTVANTNVPPNGTYLLEMFSWTGSTNPSATLLQGKITVNQSLYEEGDDLFPWPDASNIYVTKLVAGTGVTLSPSSGLGDVTISASSGGGGGGDVTSVAGRTGDVVIVSVDLADFTSSVGTNADVVANTAKIGYTEALVNANVSVASNTAKVAYTDAGNVALLDAVFNYFTGDAQYNATSGNMQITEDSGFMTVLFFNYAAEAMRLRHDGIYYSNSDSQVVDIANQILKDDLGTWQSEGPATGGIQIVNYDTLTNKVESYGYGVGDFLADGSVPMTGDFNGGGQSATGLVDVIASGTNSSFGAVSLTSTNPAGISLTTAGGIRTDYDSTNSCTKMWWAASNRWAQVQIIGAQTNVTFVSP